MGPDDMSKGRAEASRASDPTPPVCIKPNEILSLPSGYVELNNFQAQGSQEPRLIRVSSEFFCLSGMQQSAMNGAVLRFQVTPAPPRHGSPASHAR